MDIELLYKVMTKLKYTIRNNRRPKVIFKGVVSSMCQKGQVDRCGDFNSYEKFLIRKGLY